MTTVRIDPAPTELHPPIEPYTTGHLAVGRQGARHELYWEVSGNPEGLPALFLHGGPGGGTRPGVRQFFDPAIYRIVLLDQRGSGQSRPNVADDFEAALADNTTDDLVADLEMLREHLGIERWHLVLGGSWGSTLALAYAQAHPARLNKVLLRGVFTFLAEEVDHLFRDGSTALNHPDVWAPYRDFILQHPKLQPTPPDDLLQGYRLLLDDPSTRDEAAKVFVGYELGLSKAHRDAASIAESLARPSRLIPFASLEVVYMLAAGFMKEGRLVEPANLERMRGLQVAIVHGRADVVCRPDAAWRLHRALEDAGVTTTLWFIDGAGHSDSEPGIAGALRSEADRLAVDRAPHRP